MLIVYATLVSNIYTAIALYIPYTLELVQYIDILYRISYLNPNKYIAKSVFYSASISK